MSGGTLTLDLDAINPKWKVRTASQSKTLLTDLIRTPCPSILLPEASAAKRSAEDRFKLAVQQMQQLAHVASLTESSYASLLSCLPSFMNALKGMAPSCTFSRMLAKSCLMQRSSPLRMAYSSKDALEGDDVGEVVRVLGRVLEGDGREPRDRLALLRRLVDALQPF